MKIQINGNSLDIDQVVDVARNGARVEIAPDAVEKIEASAALIRKLVERDIAIYGVTTGIGEFARIRVSPRSMAIRLGARTSPWM